MLKRLWKPAFWLALVFAFAMAVHPQPPDLVSDTPDTFWHVLAFLALTSLASLAWPESPPVRIGWRLCAFGALIECVQAIPMLGRDADLWDWMADAAAVAAVLLIFLAGRRLTATSPH